ncbi:MAG: tRNA uridine-5-carboxymethylaminomethyl(34) synthesis GTPase MnmE [Pseudobdellovibrionaceae bacterium]
MYSGDRDSQTICAVSTPHGVGGISVIRISGPRSLEVTRKIAKFLPEKIESHKVYFGTLQDFSVGEAVDEVLVAYFQKGHSFTGEEVLEISCHGNPQICQSILKLLIAGGARSADKGEFTYRAFMNGNVDLVQAESILALIESQSKQAHRLALRQLKGLLSQKLEKLEDSLTWLMAHIEAGIDFSTEGLELLDLDILSSRLSEIETLLKSLVNSYKTGKILKEGIQIVLAGCPNVGKSSLLNLFLEEDRAIVTPVAGTTRDVISGDTQYNGIKLTFLDTAGIRNHTSDVVEQIGIKKSREAHTEADIILFVFDLSVGIQPEDEDLLKQLPKNDLFVVGNKLDQIKEPTQIPGFEKLTQYADFDKRNLFFVSALDQNARSLVLKEISSRYSQTDQQDYILLSNARHYENLSKALSNVVHCHQLMNERLGSEFLAIELKEALMAVQETLGKRFDDQIMDRVFKEFCLGK